MTGIERSISLSQDDKRLTFKKLADAKQLSLQPLSDIIPLRYLLSSRMTREHAFFSIVLFYSVHFQQQSTALSVQTDTKRGRQVTNNLGKEMSPVTVTAAEAAVVQRCSGNGFPPFTFWP